MRSAFKIFFTSEGSKPWLVLFSLMLASALEIIGIGVLLPLFSTAIGAEQPWLGQITLSIFSALGITANTNQLITFLLLVFTAKYVLTYLTMNISSFTEAEVSARLRTRLLRLLFGANWRYLTSRKTGQLTNEIINNASRAASAYRQSARFFSYGVQAFFYVCAAFLVSLGLTVTGIIVGLVFYLSFGFFVKRSRQLGQRQTKNLSVLSTLLSDTLNNIKPIRAMERQAHTVDNILDQNSKVRATGRRMAIISNAVYTISDAFLVGTLLLGLYVATVWFKIPFSELAVMAIVAIRAIETLKQTQNCRQTLAGIESAYWSAQKQIETLNTMQEIRNGVLIPSLTDSCTFEGVSFEHNTVPVVQNISLSIPANDITVLVGPSGAGKTTIVDLLLGLHRPTKGTIAIDGVPLDEIELGRWRAMIGYVPQETTLLHGTLRQNVTLDDPSITEEAIQEALRLSGADAFVNQLPDGLETIAGEMGTRFSGGERQRIALARALVLQPKMLLLDEVTSALDPKTELEICSNIANLKGTLTILAVTHREAWTSIAGKIYRVENGSVDTVEADVMTQATTKGVLSS